MEVIMIENKGALLALKEEIKQGAAEGVAFNRQIHQSTGLDRHNLRREKKLVGIRTRHLLLAYTLILGRMYERQERQGSSAPYVSLVVDSAMRVGVQISCESVEAWIVKKDAVQAADSHAA